MGAVERNPNDLNTVAPSLQATGFQNVAELINAQLGRSIGQISFLAGRGVSSPRYFCVRASCAGIKRCALASGHNWHGEKTGAER